MSIAWFAAFRHEAALSDADPAWLDPVLAATPALSRALVHTPASRHDPYLDHGRMPALVRQLHFDDVARLSGVQRHLQTQATPEAPLTLRGGRDTAGCARARVSGAGPVATMCSHLVAYEGEANDLDACVAHCITHHTAIMAHFPHIREIEIGTRLDWRGALSGPHVNHMVRNNVVFDDPPGLTTALNSPVWSDMGVVHTTFRKSTGPATHFPVHTAVVDLSHHAGAVAAPRCGG